MYDTDNVWRTFQLLLVAGIWKSHWEKGEFPWKQLKREIDEEAVVRRLNFKTCLPQFQLISMSLTEFHPVAVLFFLCGNFMATVLSLFTISFCSCRCFNVGVAVIDVSPWYIYTRTHISLVICVSQVGIHKTMRWKLVYNVWLQDTKHSRS